jgi:hypothetical protein
VFRLSQALEHRFDGYFSALPKVRFSQCTLGFQTRFKKPEWRSEWAFGARASSGAGSGFVLQGGV